MAMGVNFRKMTRMEQRFKCKHCDGGEFVMRVDVYKTRIKSNVTACSGCKRYNGLTQIAAGGFENVGETVVSKR